MIAYCNRREDCTWTWHMFYNALIILQRYIFPHPFRLFNVIHASQLRWCPLRFFIFII